jgi:hypothetical protein
MYEPIWNSPSDLGTFNSHINYQFSATPTDGARGIRYESADVPPGLTLSPSGLLIGDIYANYAVDKKTFMVTAKAVTSSGSDLKSSVTKEFTLHVDSWIAPPPLNLGLFADAVDIPAIEFTVSPTEAFAPPVQYTVTDFKQIGTLKLVPSTFTQNGHVFPSLKLTGNPGTLVTDAAGSFTISVVKPNEAHLIDNKLPQTITISKTFSYTVLASATPQWSTPSALPSCNELNTTSYALGARPAIGFHTVQYSLLNGEIPSGMLFNNVSGNYVLSGKPGAVAADTTYEFTIRATQMQGTVVIGRSDRTFTLTVLNTVRQAIDTIPGLLGDMSRYQNASKPAATIDKLIVKDTVTVTGNGNNVTTSNVYVQFGVAHPYDYGLYNKSLVYITGSNVTGLNNNRFYLSEVNLANGTAKLSGDFMLSTGVTPTSIGISNTQSISGNTTIAVAQPDSEYFATQLTANVTTDPGTTANFSIASGNLPDGLKLYANGLIAGYPTASGLIDSSGTPTASLKHFTVALTSNSSSTANVSAANVTTSNYCIAVYNQEWEWSVVRGRGDITFPGRRPALLNNRPLANLSVDDPYYSYYTSGNSIGEFKSADRLVHKLVGHNFNASELQGSEYGLTYKVYGIKDAFASNATASFTPATANTSAYVTLSSATGLAVDGNISFTSNVTGNIGSANANVIIAGVNYKIASINGKTITIKDGSATPNASGSSTTYSTDELDTPINDIAAGGWINGTLANANTGIATYRFNTDISTPNLFSTFSTSATFKKNSPIITLGGKFGADDRITTPFLKATTFNEVASLTPVLTESLLLKNPTAAGYQSSNITTYTTDGGKTTTVVDVGNVADANGYYTVNTTATLSFYTANVMGTPITLTGNLASLTSNAANTQFYIGNIGNLLLGDINDTTGRMVDIISVDSTSNRVNALMSTKNLTLTLHEGSARINADLTTGNSGWSFIVGGALTTSAAVNSVIGDFGTIDNGAISYLDASTQFTIPADTASTTRYRIVAGSLPAGLELISTGEIIGRVAFQSSEQALADGEYKKWSFTIEQYDNKYAELRTRRVCTLTTYQRYVTAPTADSAYTSIYDNLYVEALPSLAQRATIKTFLDSVATAAGTNVYRPRDRFFGISKHISYAHLYGVKVKSAYANTFYDAYVAALAQNHYGKQLTLGELTWAIGRDTSGSHIYDVIYSPVIDSYVNSAGDSINKTVLSSDGIVYPNALQNMRDRFKDAFGVIADNSDILPRWMVSQQASGEVLGYTAAWVVCYLKPGTAAAILEKINAASSLELNSINFTMDRLVVDRSLSSAYGVIQAQSDSWVKYVASFTPASDAIGINSTDGLYIGQRVKLDADVGAFKTDTPYTIIEMSPRLVNGTSSGIKLAPDTYKKLDGTISANVISDQITGVNTAFHTQLYAGVDIVNSSNVYIGTVLRVNDIDSSTTPPPKDPHRLTLTGNSTQNLYGVEYGTMVVGNVATVATANGTANLITSSISTSLSDTSRDSYVYFYKDMFGKNIDGTANTTV